MRARTERAWTRCCNVRGRRSAVHWARVQRLAGARWAIWCDASAQRWCAAQGAPCNRAGQSGCKETGLRDHAATAEERAALPCCRAAVPDSLACHGHRGWVRARGQALVCADTQHGAGCGVQLVRATGAGCEPLELGTRRPYALRGGGLRRCVSPCVTLGWACGQRAAHRATTAPINPGLTRRPCRGGGEPAFDSRHRT